MSEKPTRAQRMIARSLGIDVSKDSRQVAAARILDFVSEAIGERYGRRPATLKQIEYGRELGIDIAFDSIRVASANIAEELQRRNAEAISRLGLKPGDQVLKRTVFERNGVRQEIVQEFVVSSIQPNSRIFFKGGNGRGAWPSELEKVINHHSE